MTVELVEKILKTLYKTIEIKCKPTEKTARHRFVPPPLNSWTKLELRVNEDEKEGDDWRDIAIFVKKRKSKSGKITEMQVELIMGMYLKNVYIENKQMYV